jgi:hypothetical protein
MVTHQRIDDIFGSMLVYFHAAERKNDIHCDSVIHSYRFSYCSVDEFQLLNKDRNKTHGVA